MSTLQRIRTGFHRIGITIAVVIGVPSIGAMLMSLPIGMGVVGVHGHPVRARRALS